MRQNLVYDLPTRTFHWLFAGFFLTSFAIAQIAEEESPWFNYHSLAGFVLAFLVLLRVLWGFIGTTHARFSDFALRPFDLADYFKGILSGERSRWAGHNPASSWTAVLMMLMALGLAVTGYLMTSVAEKDSLEDIHELLANGFMIVVGLHVAGIVVHTIRHKEAIGLSMIDGKKVNGPVDQSIPSSRSAFGFLLLGLIIVFSLYLLRNYDPQTRTLGFFGNTLQLSESKDPGMRIRTKLKIEP